MNKLISAGLVGVFVVADPFQYARGELINKAPYEERERKLPQRENKGLGKILPLAVIREEEILPNPIYNQSRRFNDFSKRYNSSGKRRRFYDRKMI